MISYRPFWETLDKSFETTYTLINNYGISSGTLHRLKQNKPISTDTINKLAYILRCNNVNQIIEYIPHPSDAEDFFGKDKEGKISWQRTIKNPHAGQE